MNQNIKVKSDFECCYLTNMDGVISYSPHRYRIEVCVESYDKLMIKGYVINFRDLKNIVDTCTPDHMVILPNSNKHDPNVVQAEQAIQSVCDTYSIPYTTIDLISSECGITAESIIDSIVTTIQKVLDRQHPGLVVVHATLKENSFFTVEWTLN